MWPKGMGVDRVIKMRSRGDRKAQVGPQKKGDYLLGSLHSQLLSGHNY